MVRVIVGDVEQRSSESTERNRKSSVVVEEGNSEDEFEQRRGGTNVRRMLKLGVREWAQFVYQENMNVHIKIFARCSQEKVEDAVKFIYDSRFRQLLAHGVKKVKLQDGSRVSVPTVPRTMSKNTIKRE